MGLSPADRRQAAPCFFVWYSTDEDGTVQAASWMEAGMIVPLAHTDEEQARLMEPQARKVAAARGLPVTLGRFDWAGTLTTVGP